MTPLTSDCLYLTSTGRLARSLRHRFRMSCLEKELKGWEPLRAMSLNAWIIKVWMESWPEKTPASELYCMKLWKELTDSVPQPGVVNKDIGLCRMLDENYEIMIRHKIDPARGIFSTPLVEWRRDISGAFKKKLEENGFFHRSELPVFVCEAIEKNKIVCPEKIILTGFEYPAPVEADLFKALENRSDVKMEEFFDCHEDAAIEAVSLPSPEQETAYLVGRLAEDAKSIPLHRIGVVVPDMAAFSNALERDLGDVLGDEAPRGSYWFNFTFGRPVLEMPLVKAALLPLKFVLEGQPREALLSLILSPYYGYWQGKRHKIARAERVWMERAVESGIYDLIKALRGRPDISKDILSDKAEDIISFFMIDSRKKRTSAWWADEMKRLWDVLDFPVLSDEKDELAARHLGEIVRDIEMHLSDTLMDGYEFLSWISHAAGGVTTQTGASEDAGIQILGLIESRGLDFDKLYVLDMNDKSLPQPVRPLPFLDTSERKIVQGGTPESQYEFAAGVFDRLIHCSGDITLLRAEQDGSAQLSPSPFWPEGEIKESIDIWNKPNRAWLRADWLRIAHGEAMSSSKENNAGDSEGKSYIPEALPGGLSASSMERAIVCPYRFFADTVLKIEPMERIRSFVSPAERGTRMHRILASFTKEMRKKNLDPSEDEDKIRRLLTKCAEEVLKDALHCPYWEIERRLWIGSDSPSEGGLLLAWLGEEINRSKDGWRCVAEEVFFDNLKCENWPFSLHGRIDRIDCHKTGAVACLDYKTGRAPSSSDVTTRMIAPQLPIYLLALREKKIPDMEKYVDVQNGVSAGYIHLKSQKDVRIYDIKDIDLSLDKWVDKISEMGRILAAGDFPAIPYPVSDYKRKEDACRDCEFITLCEKGLQQEITLSEEGNDDGRSY